ncbi:hypothetical protein ABPG72_009049 [Tetrahymena utriculariae]
MKIQSSQAVLFNNKQLPVQSIPNGITLHQRSQSNSQLDYNQQAHARINQNLGGQQQTPNKQNSNVFPLQKIQPILKNQNVITSNQLACKSARCSPQKAISSHISNNSNTSNHLRLNKTPSSFIQQQQDIPQQSYQNYVISQAQQQMNNNSVNNIQNNSINQVQPVACFIKQLGGQQFYSSGREQANQQAQQQKSQMQQQNSQQYLQRAGGMQSYFKPNQFLNERDQNTLNQNNQFPQKTGNFQAQDYQQLLQQAQYQKQQAPPLHYQTLVQNQMPLEIISPLMKNQKQNLEDLEQKKFAFNVKKDENEVITSPKTAKQFAFGKTPQQSRPQVQQLNLQNITNNMLSIQKNVTSSQVPKSRAISSISLKCRGLENQENYSYKEFVENLNDNNVAKKGNIQLQTHQTNKTLGTNLEILNSQIQLDQLMKEARQQQQTFADQNQQFELNQNENQLNFQNNRFESFQINESLNTFQAPQYTVNNNNITSQFTSIQLEKQTVNQNFLLNLFNSEQNAQDTKQNTSQNQQSLHLNELKPNINLKLLQFQQHQQKQSQSPESYVESNIEGEQTQRACEFQNENPKYQQPINNNEKKNEIQNNPQDNSSNNKNNSFSQEDVRNEYTSNQISERDQYKQKFLQLQDENDRLQGLIKNLQIQFDEKATQKEETEVKLQKIEQKLEELQTNNEQLQKEKEQKEYQIKELNQVLESQNDQENRYFLLEEKCSFYEQELSMLKQKEKEKISTLEKVKENIKKANNYETDSQNIQLEEYIYEKVIILLERQKYQIFQLEQFETEIEQKTQDLVECQKQVKDLSEKLKEYEVSLQKYQQDVEERYKVEYNNYYKTQQEQEVLANSKINQLSQDLVRIKKEISTTQELKISEINSLNQEIENYKQQLQQVQQQNQSIQTSKQGQGKIKQLEQLLENVEKQNQDLICINNMYLQQITELKSEHSKCYTIKTENETLKISLDNFTFQIKDRESEIRQLLLKLEIKQNELNQVQKCYDYQTKQSEQEIGELKQRLESNTIQQNTNKNEQIVQQEMEFNKKDELSQRNKMLSQENDQLKYKLINLENQIDQLSMEYQQSEENQQILQQEIFNLRQYIDNQNQEYIKQQSQILNDGEESVVLKGDYEQEALDQSGVKNLDSLMQVLSCQTIGTNYYKQ